MSNVSWYQSKAREAQKAYMEYREAEMAKGRTYAEVESDPQWLKLRLTELQWRNFWIEDRAAVDAYLNRSGSEKRLGKLYGKASQRIHSLRSQLRALDAFWHIAIRQCTCGAFRKAYNEARGNDLDDLRGQLEAEKEITKRLRKMLREKAS